METATDALMRGRDAFARQAWREAFAALSAADADGGLGPGDLQDLATAAYLVGEDAASDDALERAHRLALDRDDTRHAARCAFWLGMIAVNRGDVARGSGWLGRAGRLLEDDPGCAEQGYLMIPSALMALEGGDPGAALDTFRRAEEVADRFAEVDLRALARLGQGQTLVEMTEADQGLAVLDEVMVGVQAGEVSPIPSGIIYCAVIDACRKVFDLRRAQEWTDALSHWCDTQPDLVPFRGQCLVHRSQILQLHGDWPDALDEAVRACQRLSEPTLQPAVGAAYYQLAEVHRLRGELVDAEEAYRLASQHGRSPQPGLARLRLSQGDTEAADAAVRRALDETSSPLHRAELLAARVEIALAADDVRNARAAADELSSIASDVGAPLLHATSSHVTGAVQLAEGNARAALSTLRGAWDVWRELEAPYEAARVRVLRGLACQELGDVDGAHLELDAARQVFGELGATPELASLDELTERGRSAHPRGLTDREVEVLRLVATGKSNRAIAEELVISEHTVARHVQNIFAKLDVPSRTAAAAFAFAHELA